MHQRSCQVIHNLNEELCADLEEQITRDNTEDTPENDNDGNNIDVASNEGFPELKKGVNLPKNDIEWSTANDYFKCALQANDPIRSQDDNWKTELLNDVICNYFADNFGHTKTVPDKDMVAKYNKYTVKELKKALQSLKSSKGDLSEIKYISHTLRDKLRNKNKDDDNGLICDNNKSINHDKYLGQNVWGTLRMF